jgi:riboflavin synthase
MFTGIINEIGTIEKIDKKGDWIVHVSASFHLGDLVIGTSVACDGICLTVIDKTSKCFVVQLSTETVRRQRLVGGRPEHW